MFCGIFKLEYENWVWMQKAEKHLPSFKSSGANKTVAGIQLLCCGPISESDSGWFDTTQGAGTRCTRAEEETMMIGEIHSLTSNAIRSPHLPASTEFAVSILRVQAIHLKYSIKSSAPTYTVLLKTFVITVILVKPHQLCPCLPLTAFLCILLLSYHIVTGKKKKAKKGKKALSKTQTPCSECHSAISGNSISSKLLGICLYE